MTKSRNKHNVPRAVLPQRGVATGVHNAALARIQDLQQRLVALQRILSAIVAENDNVLVVDIVPIPGQWSLLLKEVPSIMPNINAVRLELVPEITEDNANA